MYGRYHGTIVEEEKFKPAEKGVGLKSGTSNAHLNTWEVGQSLTT